MTTTAVLGVLLAFAAIAVAAAAGWVVAGCAALVIQRVRPTTISSASRAVLLAQARLMPLVFVVVLVPAQIIAFSRFEVGGSESAGPLLIAAALAGLALLADALARAGRSWRQTRAIVSSWRDFASPLMLPTWTRPAWRIRRRFPVVAVVGVVRPELFVASQVARQCTSGELTAIAAHEAAHVESHDNLLRLMFCITPGASMASAIAEPLERAWMLAAEEAADARARRETSALELASAVTKVARLAIDCPREPMPASALIGGHQLESRVHRLLEPDRQSRCVRFAWIPAALVVTASVALQTSPALARLHELFELLVRR